MIAALAGVAPVAWIWLLTLHGGFWRADRRLGCVPGAAVWPAVAVLIPARDEAATIARVLEAHAASAYPGPLSVILVDDQSSDGTGRIAREVAARAPRPVHVLDAPTLPHGWTGKLHALATAEAALPRLAPQARWLLLSDADILHAPDTLARLVARAEADGLALVSLMARLDARGFWGRLLIPASVFFFQKLYPFVCAASIPLIFAVPARGPRGEFASEDLEGGDDGGWRGRIWRLHRDCATDTRISALAC